MLKNITIAFHEPSQKYIHIEKAQNGLKCNCICLECEDKMEAVQGEVNAKHFRHHTNKKCNPNPETLLHKLASQIICENDEIFIPKYGKITYLNPKKKEKLEGYEPDVSAEIQTITKDNQQIFFYIEIAVTHKNSQDKEKYYKSNKLKSVEIYLDKYINETYENIYSAIIKNTEEKKIIYWEEKPINSSFKELKYLFIKVLAIIAIIKIVKKIF